MSDVIGFTKHNHKHCVSTALKAAQAQCDARGVRLTPVRRRTLEVLLEHHRALGAYDVLERLQEDGYGSKPPIAYRALGFLVEQGLAHRVERLNAYVACAHPDRDHTPAILICSGCHKVAEAIETTQNSGLRQMQAETGFTVSTVAIEAEGTCSDCTEKAHS